MRVVLNLVAACLVVATPVTALQWPDFRGPTGQGHSEETSLPLTWSETSNVVWKQAVPGRGWSTPIVESGRLWLTTAVRNGSGGSLRALAFDVETGKNVVDVEVFRTATGDSPNPKNSLASPTPIAAGGRIFVHFGADGTAALSPDGAILWKVRLPYQSQHGSGGSPIAYDDLLIVNCDGSDVAYVVAIEQATGKIRWKTERRRPFDQAYTTPLVIRVGDVDQVVSVGAHRAAAYDPKTGAEVWRVGYPNGFSNVPRPVYGHGLVFIATGFQQPAILAVRPDGRGDVTGTHVAWTLTRGAPFTPSPILVGGELYLVSDLGVATCVDAKSGKVLWQQRLGGNYSASPVFADGRLHFQSEEGVTTVLQPGREFRRLAVNQIDGSTLGSMSVAGNSLFIRSSSHLYRIGVSR